MKYIIRADSSQTIGSGHIMRCLTLAKALRGLGKSVEFICRAHSGNWDSQITKQGFKVHSLPHPKQYKTQVNLKGYAEWLGVDQQIDARETTKIISKTQVEWLIIDHYALTLEWEHQLRPFTQNIMVIDDLFERHHDCDLFLDMAVNRRSIDYQKKLPKHCKLLLGTEYSLLRSQFLKYRPIALKRREENQNIMRILVAMGGSDPLNATNWALREIESANIDAEVDVVMGEHAPYSMEIKERITQMKTRVNLHFQIDNMAEFMTQADLAIGAAGTTSWERCCLGLPTLVLVTEDNQKNIAQALHARGAIINLGWFHSIQQNQLKEILIELLKDRKRIFLMAKKAALICDGEGIQRVTREMVHEA